MSKPFIIPQVSVTLNEVVRDFETWRKSKAHSKSRIPEELWESAVTLTKHYPISKISQILKLNHTELKRRVSHASSTRPSFIQVDLPSTKADTFSQGGTPRPRCLIELESSVGIRFRCTVYDTIPEQLLTFCHSLLSGLQCSS